MCWYAHTEEFVPHMIMVKRMVETSSSSIVHRVIDANINPYRNMVIGAMRMNQSGASKCPIIDEEPNTNAIMFFIFEKTMMNHFGMIAQNIVNY